MVDPDTLFYGGVAAGVVTAGALIIYAKIRYGRGYKAGFRQGFLDAADSIRSEVDKMGREYKIYPMGTDPSRDRTANFGLTNIVESAIAEAAKKTLKSYEIPDDLLDVTLLMEPDE